MDKERLLAQQRRFLMAQNSSAISMDTRPTRGYEIKNFSDGTAEIALYDEIGPWGISAVRFTDELRAITAKSITLRVASPGGDVADGLAILNALRQHPAMINVIVEGWAASAASFIAMAGNTIQMAPNSMIMIHDAMTICAGNAEEFLEVAALLDKHSDNIADVYQRRAGGTVAEWRQRMRDTTWYTAQEAVDAGLADGILGEGEGFLTPDEGAPKPDEEKGKKPAVEPERASASTRVTITATVAPTHHTATVDTPWDGGAAEKNLPKPIPVATAKKVYAWYDESQVEDGAIPREAASFPHHEVSADGTPGAANLPGVRNALARLTQSDVPESDHEAIKAHLQAHLDDAKGDDEPADNVGDNDVSNEVQGESILTALDLQMIRDSITAAKEATTHG